MGCGSSGSKDKKVGGGEAKPKSAAVPKRERLDPKDFIVSKRSGQTIIKEDGTIRGEQFNIEECTDCDIFLFDHSATILVDECHKCRFFIGPVESSIFFRNCSDIDVVAACQQFRSRDCSNCRFALFVGTEPIIETSQNMQFACFDFFYFALRQQMDKAKLKIWNNKWWQVHDFNKNAANPNWSLFPQEDVPRFLRTSECTSISEDELRMDRVVPVTLGSRPRPSEEVCFVIFLPLSETLVEDFLRRALRTEGWTICRTRSTVMPEQELASLFTFAGKEQKKLVAACKGKEITGIEVCGPDVFNQTDTLSQDKEHSTKARLVPSSDSPLAARVFFEVWKDEI